MIKRFFNINDVVMPETNSGVSIDLGDRCFLSNTRTVDKVPVRLSVSLDSFISPEKHKGYIVTSEQLNFPDYNGKMYDAFMVKSLETGYAYVFKAEECVLKYHTYGKGSYYLVDDNSFAHEAGKRKHIQILCPLGEDMNNYPEDGTPMLILENPFKSRKKCYDNIYKTYDFVKVRSLRTQKEYVVLYNKDNEIKYNFEFV